MAPPNVVLIPETIYKINSHKCKFLENGNPVTEK